MTRRFDKPAWLPGTGKIVYLSKPGRGKAEIHYPDPEDRWFELGTADAESEGRLVRSSDGTASFTPISGA